MPVPINAVQDNGQNKTSPVDYSFLSNYMENPIKKKSKLITASNNDAELLFKIWDTGEKQGKPDTFKISSDITSKDVIRLKTYGFLTGGTEVVSFTAKGKMVITTIALSEPNCFAKKRQNKPYSEILASMSKKGKPGYRIPKYATNNSNHLDLRDK